MIAARFLTFSCILLLFFVFSSYGQRTRRPVPRPTPKPTPTVSSPIVAAARQQVANQLYNVNTFIDKMGPIAVVIENADKEAKAGRLKREAIDVNEANKKKVVEAIRGLREGLVALETDFRTKPVLKRYLPTIEGISTLCSRSEDSAIAGQFVASKDPLREISFKLNDTFAVLSGRTVTRGTPAKPSPVRSISTPIQTKPVSNQNPSTTRSDVSLGMTISEVLASSWGAPINKRVSTTANGTTEVWSYSGNRSLYFFNGKLTNIVR